MKRFLINISILFFLFLSCTKERSGFLSLNTIIFDDTENVIDYPYQKEYDLHLKAERKTIDSLREASPEHTILDPLFPPKPEMYYLNEEGNPISIKEHLAILEEKRKESITCLLELWIEWNNKLSFVKLISYKGTKPENQLILDVLKNIKFRQPEFKKGMPFPRLKVNWLLKLNVIS